MILLVDIAFASLLTDHTIEGLGLIEEIEPHGHAVHPEMM
jgi:hypothetical protein